MTIETRAEMMSLFLRNYAMSEFEAIEFDDSCRAAVSALGLVISPTATRTWRVQYHDRVEYLIADEHGAEEYFADFISAEDMLTGSILQNF